MAKHKDWEKAEKWRQKNVILIFLPPFFCLLRILPRCTVAADAETPYPDSIIVNEQPPTANPPTCRR
jgi:hypothetical protein